MSAYVPSLTIEDGKGHIDTATVCVWTLTIEDDRTTSTSVHPSWEELLGALRRDCFREDPAAPADDEDLLDYATDEAGLIIWTDRHILSAPVVISA